MKRPVPAAGPCRAFVRCAGVLLLALLLPSGLRAEVSESEILKAFEEVASKGAAASGRAQALAFKYNDLLNNLRMDNKISDRLFQINDRHFRAMNESYLATAAERNGLHFAMQKSAPGKVQTPFSDTDAIMRNLKPGAPTTAAQINAANAEYRRIVQDMLAKSGVSPPGARMPNTNTSIMPDPTTMSRAEWNSWNETARARGEVVYKNPAAAAAEAKIRAKLPLSNHEACARVAEMQRLAREHFQGAEQLREAARKASAAGRHDQARTLLNEAQTLRHNGAKYITRIHETGEYISARAGLPSRGSPVSADLKAAAVRGHSTSLKAAEAARNAQELLNQANRSFVDNLGQVAARPGPAARVRADREVVARALNNLPPGEQADAVRRLTREYGAAQAREVERFMRGLPKGTPAAITPEPPSRLQTAGRVLGAAATIYQTYSGFKAVYDAKSFEEQFAALPQEKQDEVMRRMTPEQQEVMAQAVKRLNDPAYRAYLRQNGFTWFTPAQSEEAGRQLGQFTGGLAGAAAGASVYGSIGSAVGTVLGGPGLGTSAGAVVGGIYGGFVGYFAGSKIVGEMGDTRSRYWAQNQSDEEFNRQAVAANGRSPSEVRRSLVAAGIAEETATQAAEAYRNGSLREFNGFMKAVREERKAMARAAVAARREEENRRRADDYERARDFFKQAWERTSRQEEEHEEKVEKSYRNWTETMATRSQEERRRAYQAAGLDKDQVAEVERRIGGGVDQRWREYARDYSRLTPAQQKEIRRQFSPAQRAELDRALTTLPREPTPPPMDPGAEMRVPPNEPARTGGAAGSMQAVYGQTLTIDFAQDARDANRDFFKALEKAGSQPLAGAAQQAATSARAAQEALRAAEHRRKEGYENMQPPPGGAPRASTLEEVANRGMGVASTNGNPVARAPNAGFLGGEPAPAPEPTAPGASGVQYIFHSTPTISFEPPTSPDGRTRATFHRMGEVKLWAQVVVKAGGETTTFETRMIRCQVVAPALSIAVSPVPAVAGREVKARLVASPAVASDLIRVVWSSPASSTSDELSLTPGAGGALVFQAEARNPAFGDLIGNAALTLNVGPDPGGPAQQQKLVNEGYELEKKDDLAGAVGKYREAQALGDSPAIAGRIEQVESRMRDRQRAQELVNGGFALEGKQDWAGAVEKYREADRLVPDERLVKRIASLNARIASEAEQQRREQEGRRGEELRRRDEARRAEAVRKAEEDRRAEEARQARIAGERVAREQAAREETARREAARQAAERERVAREQVAREQARKVREAAARPSFDGTFVSLKQVSDSYAGEAIHISITYTLTLRQEGDRVTGTLRQDIQSDGGAPMSESGPVQGRLNGNHIALEGPGGSADVVISPDGNSLRVSANGETSEFRRQ